MNVQSNTTHPIELADARKHLVRRLRGRWLVLVRLLWIAVVVFILALLVASIPAFIATLHTACTTVPCQLFLEPYTAKQIQAVGLSVDFSLTYIYIIQGMFWFAFLIIGAIIFWLKSDDFMALYTSFAFVTFAVGFNSSILAALLPAWWLPIQTLAFFSSVLFAVLFYLFPNGKFVPRWAGWLVVGWVVYSAVNYYFPNSPLNNSRPIRLFFLCLVVSVLVAQVYRYRRISSQVERQQTKWVIFGVSIGLVGLALVLLLGISNLLLSIFPFGPRYDLIAGTAVFVFILFIPLSIAFAILHSRLWEIDLIINRTLVYGALTLSVIGLYVLVVVGLGTLIQIQGNVLLSLLATGVIAVLFQPLRLRLQRGVNRLMYGERDEPYAVLARLGSRLEATLVPEKVLPTIVETVAQTLKLPYVAISLLPEQDPFNATGTASRAGVVAPDIIASSGSAVPEPVRMPLVYQTETIGYLLLATRAGDTFSKQDRRLLTDLARQVGVALYAVQLTTHLRHLTMRLQESREHLVTTREEERRRLRRDLHDGLGPTLASLTFKVDAARNVLVQDSTRADTLLDSVRQLAQEAISDIRRLVYNLRPPALDELGLLSALREQAAHYQHQVLELVFDTPETLPPLPAAVEVAAYRIAQEALTNVARHASAQHCLLRLAIDAEILHLDISDDGKGIPSGHRIGIGLHTMHERASELGGSCTITASSQGGTAIRVRLPLAAAADVPATSSLVPEQPEQKSTLTPNVSLVRQDE
jgi:signal transduction histidine kinase